MIRLDISNTYIYITFYKFIIRNNVCHRLSRKNAENRGQNFSKRESRYLERLIQLEKYWVLQFRIQEQKQF